MTHFPFRAALPRHPLGLAACLLAFLSAPMAVAQIVVRDDTGQELHLAQPARRVVSLAPNVTENLFAIGAGGRLVATVEYSNYPPAARQVPRIGSYAQVDLEALVAKKPDLVIAWESGNASAQLAKIRALGIPVFQTEPKHIEDVAASLERLGLLTGTADAARAAAKAYRERLAALRTRYGSQPSVRTFYQVWHQPLMTVGGGQIISDAIVLCGGENVFGTLTALAPTVSVEAVIAANPEAIVASGMDEARPEWLDQWRPWRAVTAVARDNLFFVPPDLIQRHTPRLLDGAERLCQHLQTARQRRPR